MRPVKRTWQKVEERVCAKFGGRRTPLSGKSSGHGTSADCIPKEDQPDTFLLPNAYIEVKHREKFLHHTLFKDVKNKAKKEGKVPILVTHEKFEEGELVILRLDDFVAILK